MNLKIETAGHSVRGLANWTLDYADKVGARLTNMALNKILYFLVEDSLLRSKVLLTSAKIEAWEHGPVFREIYQSFKIFGDRPISGRASFYSAAAESVQESIVELNDAEAERLKSVLDALIFKSASELRRMSHVADGAWFRAWWYEGHANPGMEITPASIIEASGQI